MILQLLRGCCVRTVPARSFHASVTNMAALVKVGDRIPSVDLYEDSPANAVNIADLMKGKKVILFGVPGAFTPGCSQTHLPSYTAKAEDLKKEGVDEVVCMAVNDPFVTGAWAKDQKTQGKVRILADTQCELTKALGLELDLVKPLGSTRCKRFSMIVDDGVVSELNVEPDGTGLTCSLADRLKIKK